MNQQVKSIIKQIIPPKVIYKLRAALAQPKLTKARKTFEQAEGEPGWLGAGMLEKFQQRYSFPPEYGYDPQSLERRGKERAREILRLVKNKNINTFFELGCWDGMVSCILHRHGKIATAVDNRSEGFDERAIREGVKLLKMDAAHLEFKDESFDFVFSYDSFEHFTHPDLVLQEAIRVAKKGGFIYLVFGPLYMSPKGLHAYRSVTVPYCQFLFQKEVLRNFTQVKGLEPIDFDQLNGWSLDDYRELWNRYSHILKKVKYYEQIDPSGLDLIMEYPSCFKSKTPSFDNLIVSSIEVLFEKI